MKIRFDALCRKSLIGVSFATTRQTLRRNPQAQGSGSALVEIVKMYLMCEIASRDELPKLS